jgi:hypothetical protein
MGIVQLIRQKLGAAPDTLDSSVLTQAVDEALGEIKSLDSEILTREQRLGRDSIESPDGGEAAGRELQELRSKRDRLSAKCNSLRREIDEALKREADTEQISRFEAAAEKGRQCLTLAADLIAALAPVIAIASALDDATSELAGSIAAVPYPLVNLGDSGQEILSARPTRLTVLAVQDPEGLEKAIASVVSTMKANGDSIRREAKGTGGARAA